MERFLNRLGLNADGVHRFMYRQSYRDGILDAWPAMLAREYGINEDQFQEQVEHLKAAGKVIHHPRPRQRAQHYQIAEPQNYDSNDRYLGQRGKGFAPVDPRQEILDAIEYTLEHRDEWDDDQVADFEDMIDELGAGSL